IVKNAMSSPFELAGVGLAVLCHFTCPVPGSGAYTACETVKLISQIGIVTGSIKGLVNQGFKSPQDYCSRLNLDENATSTATT
ncbi:MAG: hypothetical protein AABX25_04800, partial [Nanoarchaeota archaeon]